MGRVVVVWFYVGCGVCLLIMMCYGCMCYDFMRLFCMYGLVCVNDLVVFGELFLNMSMVWLVGFVSVLVSISLLCFVVVCVSVRCWVWNGLCCDR